MNPAAIGFIKYETLASDIKRFRAYIGGNNLVVDHLNDNTHINTEYNLSLMSSDDNHRKSDIISKIKEPASVAYLGCSNG